jgi:hypothetical protein
MFALQLIEACGQKFAFDTRSPNPGSLLGRGFVQDGFPRQLLE